VGIFAVHGGEDVKDERGFFDDTSSPVGSVEPVREFRIGDATKLDILKRGFNGLELKKICDDGSLEAVGDTVLTVVNQTKNEWAGENEDIARKS